MNWLRKKRGFLRDSGGGTALEFGFIVPLFVLLVIGVIEMGILFFANAALEGGLREAARFAITGQNTGNSREKAIIDIINRHGYGIVTVTADNVTTKVYEDFASIEQHEPIVGDKGDIGTYEAGIDDGYTDVNCNGQWDADISKDGVGGGNDVVLYLVNYEHQMLTGFLTPLIGKDGKIPLAARIAVRNEPFGNSELCTEN